jgi:hypothetical protein
MLIGMLHTRKDPNKVSRSYLYATVAKSEGAEFFYFTPKHVDFEKKIIYGKYFEDGMWKEKYFPVPNVIINANNPQTKKQDEIINKLKKISLFTSFPVGSKLEVYDKIVKAERFSQYVIPYNRLKKVDQIYEFIEKYEKIVIKPVRGHHGDDVMTIEKKNSDYILKKRNKRVNYTKQELDNYVNSLIESKKMLIQKYIKCRLKTKEPFDLRIHMQKDGNCEWSITLIFPRIGSIRRVATNLSQGATMMELDKFLINEYGEDKEKIRKILRDFAIDFTKHFETLYPYGFDELGIDIGLDNDNKIWIYEVNYRPGHVFIEVITARNAVKYAICLAKKSMKGGISNKKNKI